MLLSASAPDLARTNRDAVTGLAWLGPAFSAPTCVPTNLMGLAAVDQVGTARASVYVDLQPFFGVISALLVLSEKIHALHWAGGSLISPASCSRAAWAGGLPHPKSRRPRHTSRAVARG